MARCMCRIVLSIASMIVWCSVCFSGESESRPRHAPLFDSQAGWLNLVGPEIPRGPFGPNGRLRAGQNDSASKIPHASVLQRLNRRSIVTQLTDIPFADFEMLIEFTAGPGTDGGFLVRSMARWDEPPGSGSETLITVASRDEDGFLTGSINRETRSQCDVYCDDNEPHTLAVICRGATTTTFLDGRFAAERTQPSGSPKRRWGVVGAFNDSEEETRLVVHRIRVRPIALTSLFDGETLKRWRVVKGATDDTGRCFQVVDGSLRPGRNGRMIVSTAPAAFPAGKRQLIRVEYECYGRSVLGVIAARRAIIHEGVRSAREVLIRDDSRLLQMPWMAATGTVKDVAQALPLRATGKSGERKVVTIYNHGDRIAVWVNATLVVNATDKREGQTSWPGDFRDTVESVGLFSRGCDWRNVKIHRVEVRCY